MYLQSILLTNFVFAFRRPTIFLHKIDDIGLWQRVGAFSTVPI
jgi:hypothetical protein